MGSEGRKQARERFLLDEFLREKGITCACVNHLNPPDPDFLIEINGEKIGIELTEIFIRRSPVTNETLLQEGEAIADRILSKARNSYLAKFNQPVQVFLVFARPLERATNRDDLAALIAHKIESLLSPATLDIYWKPASEECPLFEVITSIYISAVPEATFARWESPKVGLVSTLRVEQVQNAIEWKAKKISTYRTKFDQHWLLLVADRTRPSQMLTSPRDFRRSLLSTPFDQTHYYVYGPGIDEGFTLEKNILGGISTGPRPHQD